MKRRKYIFFKILILFLFLIFLNLYKQFSFNHSYTGVIRLKSFCSKCKSDLFLYIKNINSTKIYIHQSNQNNKQYFINFKNSLEISKPNLFESSLFTNPKFTCDLYNSLKHGPNQKILSYSLYGKHITYYEYIEAIIKSAEIFYPDWIIRIYYDDSVDKSIICDLECKYDKIHFCNIHKIPNYENGFDIFENQNDVNKFIDYSYVHAMMWRWFPIFDDFVDHFASRDIDSSLIQREKDSVDVWLKEKKLFHIMRDHPYHNSIMLGGLWGYANSLNRSLGLKIYNVLVNKSVQLDFNFEKDNPKNYDQHYLELKVWPLAYQNSTIHDSYHCNRLGGKPFPTRRPSDKFCFVSCFYPCCDLNLNQSERMQDCPFNCRPLEHQDWNSC